MHQVPRRLWSLTIVSNSLDTRITWPMADFRRLFTLSYLPCQSTKQPRRKKERSRGVLHLRCPGLLICRRNK